MSEKAQGKQGGLLSILMPVYNERAYLRRCVERVLAAPLPGGLQREVIVVDDGSTDGTSALIDEIAQAHPGLVRAFRLERNQGKGAAIRRAVAEMRGQYAIFQDADLEYDPQEYGLMLRPILAGHADVVYGSRFAASPARRVLHYRHALGNKFLTHLSNVFTDLNLTDMETCYKAFRADVLRTIPLRSNRFGIEPEITAKVAKRGCAVYETPVSYYGRTYAEGKKAGWKDGVSALWTILKYWLIDDCYEERYGHGILDDLSSARRFNRWMVDAVEPYVRGRVLEIGSGIGNISRFLPKREGLIVSDIDPLYLKLLEEAFCDHDLVDVAHLDLTSDEDCRRLAGRQIDTVVCLNVLEHIEDDRAALKRLRGLLRPGGRLILLVPQYPWLYGSYGRYLCHHRRYGRGGLRRLLADCGFQVAKTKDFNSLSVLGWWVNSRLLRRETMGRFQIKLFDTLVPVLRQLEYLLPLPGLSLICVAQTPRGARTAAGDGEGGSK